MATPKLLVTITKANKVLDQLQTYKDESESLPVKYQYFIAEMIMLRLFSIFENTVSEAAFKLVAGAKYLNGTSPILNTQATTMAASMGILKTYGRTRSVQDLKWTKAKYIKNSVKYVMDINEKFITHIDIHGTTIEKMRKMRNVLAHDSTSAKQGFKDLIRQTYGADIKMTTGVFLVSTQRHTPCNLNQYIAYTRIILHDIVQGT